MVTLATGPAVASAPAAPLNDGGVRTVYLRDCAVCHGAEGQGSRRGPHIAGVGRALIDYELSTGRMPISDANEKIVRHRPRYSGAQRKAVVDYVASLEPVGSGDKTQPGGPDIPQVDEGAASLSSGGELYRLQCAACHAWAGDGGALVHREAPGLHKATPVQVAEAIRTGPGTMPAFGSAALDDQQLAAVVRYVGYLKHPRDRGGFGLWHLGPVAEGAVGWIVGIGLLVLASLWIGEREAPHQETRHQETGQ
jgi:ubiquinol-cytochrome c reductase cytochrome c subunit